MREKKCSAHFQDEATKFAIKNGRRCSGRSMSAGDCVTEPAEVVSQIEFHLESGFVRHRVEMVIEFGQESDGVALHEGG